MGTASAHTGLHGSHFIRRASGWFITIGVVFIILGMLSIIEPGVAGLAVAFLVGWILIFGGILHLISTFAGGGVGRVIWQLLLAIIYIVGGIYFLINPLLGLGTLTLFLASILWSKRSWKSSLTFSDGVRPVPGGC